MHFVYVVHAREREHQKVNEIQPSVEKKQQIEESEEGEATNISLLWLPSNAWHRSHRQNWRSVPTPNTNFNRLWHPLVTKNRFNFPSVYISNRLPFRFGFVSSFHLHAVCVFLLYLPSISSISLYLLISALFHLHRMESSAHHTVHVCVCVCVRIVCYPIWIFRILHWVSYRISVRTDSDKRRLVKQWVWQLVNGMRSRSFLGRK